MEKNNGSITYSGGIFFGLIVFGLPVAEGISWPGFF